MFWRKCNEDHRDIVEENNYIRHHRIPNARTACSKLMMFMYSSCYYCWFARDVKISLQNVIMPPSGVGSS